MSFDSIAAALSAFNDVQTLYDTKETRLQSMADTVAEQSKHFKTTTIQYLLDAFSENNEGALLAEALKGNFDHAPTVDKNKVSQLFIALDTKIKAAAVTASNAASVIERYHGELHQFSAVELGPVHGDNPDISLAGKTNTLQMTLDNTISSNETKAKHLQEQVKEYEANLRQNEEALKKARSTYEAKKKEKELADVGETILWIVFWPAALGIDLSGVIDDLGKEVVHLEQTVNTLTGYRDRAKTDLATCNSALASLSSFKALASTLQNQIPHLTSRLNTLVDTDIARQLPTGQAVAKIQDITVQTNASAQWTENMSHSMRKAQCAENLLLCLKSAVFDIALVPSGRNIVKSLLEHDDDHHSVAGINDSPTNALLASELNDRYDSSITRQLEQNAGVAPTAPQITIIQLAKPDHWSRPAVVMLPDGAPDASGAKIDINAAIEALDIFTQRVAKDIQSLDEAQMTDTTLYLTQRHDMLEDVKAAFGTDSLQAGTDDWKKLKGGLRVATLVGQETDENIAEVPEIKANMAIVVEHLGKLTGVATSIKQGRLRYLTRLQEYAAENKALGVLAAQQDKILETFNNAQADVDQEANTAFEHATQIRESAEQDLKTLQARVAAAKEAEKHPDAAEKSFKVIFPWLIMWPLEPVPSLKGIAEDLSEAVRTQQKVVSVCTADEAFAKARLDQAKALTTRLEKARAALTIAQGQIAQLDKRVTEGQALVASQIKWIDSLGLKCQEVDAALIRYSKTLETKKEDKQFVSGDFAIPLMLCVDAAIFDASLVPTALNLVFALGSGRLQDYFEYEDPRYPKDALLQVLWNRFESEWVGNAVEGVKTMWKYCVVM